MREPLCVDGCVCVCVCAHGYNVLLSPLTLKYLQMVSKVREMAPILCCGGRKHTVTFEGQVRQTMHKSHQKSLKYPSYGKRCILQHLPLHSAPVPAATGIVAAGFYACCLKFTTMMR